MQKKWSYKLHYFIAIWVSVSWETASIFKSCRQCFSSVQIFHQLFFRGVRWTFDRCRCLSWSRSKPQHYRVGGLGNVDSDRVRLPPCLVKPSTSTRIPFPSVKKQSLSSLSRCFSRSGWSQRCSRTCMLKPSVRRGLHANTDRVIGFHFLFCEVHDVVITNSSSENYKLALMRLC